MTIDSNPNDDLVAKVTKWLKDESGYPLEMTTAAALASAGFETVQGDYFPDDKTEKLRELDVTGYVAHSQSGLQVSVALLVECKSSFEKPWILFTSSHGYSPNLSVTRRSTNEQGRRVLAKLQFDENVQNSLLFRLPPKCGHALALAMRKPTENKDHAYEALMGVCAASLGHIKRLGEYAYPRIVPFDWPMIVIQVPLLECFLNSANEVVVNEVEKGTLIWRNPILNRHTIVNIYTEEGFKSEVGLLHQAATEFAELAWGAADEIGQKDKQNQSIDPEP
jgi:hypothetical protein